MRWNASSWRPESAPCAAPRRGAHVVVPLHVGDAGFGAQDVRDDVVAEVLDLGVGEVEHELVAAARGDGLAPVLAQDPVGMLAVEAARLVDHLRPSGCANQDIGFGCNGRKILGSGVTDGDGRIPLHQQKRYRTANHQRTAQDDDVLTFHIDLVMIQDLHDRLGSARRKAQVPTGKDASQRQVTATIHIFFR